VFRLEKQKLPIHDEELRDGRKCGDYLVKTAGMEFLRSTGLFLRFVPLLSPPLKRRAV
jgi:hypothetical protein